MDIRKKKIVIFEILSLYGELPNANRVAGFICAAREQKLIKTSEELTKVVAAAFPSQTMNKMLAKVFQAVRIEVNHEMEALKQMLIQTEKVLTTNGRLVVISYHSLEDRLVKNFLKTGNIEGNRDTDFYGNVKTSFEQVNKKVIVPSEDEIIKNTRSRSAKLRIGKKL